MKSILYKCLLIIGSVTFIMLLSCTTSYAGKMIFFKRDSITTVEYPDVTADEITKEFNQSKDSVSLQVYAENDITTKKLIVR